VNDWAMVLHTGESAWLWAVVLGLAGASVLLFWVSGVVIWWQARRWCRTSRATAHWHRPTCSFLWPAKVAAPGALPKRCTTHWRKLATACTPARWKNLQTTAATRQVFVLAATYGEGQAPAHASHALAHIAKLSASAGACARDRAGFWRPAVPAFCAFAKAVDATLRAKGWPALLPLECIHQQSAQQFARWGDAWRKR
jgi:sulfite reductase (NADPH) flavoprotein alpha-component